MDKIIIANWKMNPASLKDAIQLTKDSDMKGLIICPPFPYLDAVTRTIQQSDLGAQDLFWEDLGAYTGEVSAQELKDLCVKYVIIGHSERRQNLGETDEMVAKKVAAALKNDLTPILCVGETRAERDSGKTKEVVKRELEIGLSKLINFPTSQLINLVIAYEPIWAIGTGTPDTPENMLDMVKFIKEVLGVRNKMWDVKIIYGGSVMSRNANNFLKHKEIDGALVGGASLKGEEIKKIVKISTLENFNN